MFAGISDNLPSTACCQIKSQSAATFLRKGAFIYEVLIKFTLPYSNSVFGTRVSSFLT